MKHPTIILIIAALIIVGGAVAIWLVMQPNTKTTDPQQQPVQQEPQTGEVTVRMQNTAFTPQTIRVSKGTKVTWINDDTIRHNVVATDANNTGGLPTTNSLLGKGGSYEFTFNDIGTFKYHCTPHPFMTGTVIVE